MGICGIRSTKFAELGQENLRNKDKIICGILEGETMNGEFRILEGSKFATRNQDENYGPLYIHICSRKKGD